MLTTTILGGLVCVMGMMPIFDVMLNGISLVNLVVCAGIFVEFTSHVCRAFAAATGTPDERMKTAVNQVRKEIFCYKFKFYYHQ